MMDSVTCQSDARRKKLFGNADWNGLDFLEVSANQKSLCVHFFGAIPDGLTIRNIRIEGGRRIRGIQVVTICVERSDDEHLDDCLKVEIDRPGDFSTYRLCLRHADGGPLDGIDPRYACLDFSFKVDCASDLDCKDAVECAPQAQSGPDISYLAKDYASFRQLIYDRMSLIMPDWRERHAPDLGVTLVELLAYAGDHLSYYQDAVASEAYLDTARLRISVRRHLRLIDYHMHEGTNARAFVTISASSNFSFDSASEFFFITGFADIKAAGGGVVKAEDLERVPRSSYEVFEPVATGAAEEFAFFAAHSEIHFYTWGGEECCLEKGATRATLLDQDGKLTDGATGILNLKAGNFLIFEEVIGPDTANAADADPAHRHVVRLTKVEENKDELFGKHLIDIEWALEDALPSSFCLSVRRPAPHCDLIENVSVARGNVVLADHGRTVEETLGPVGVRTTFAECACEGSVIETNTVAETFSPALQHAPLVFAEPVSALSSAKSLLSRDPLLAAPQVVLRAQNRPEAAWEARNDLLASQGEDRHFVAEIDDEGRAQLRFGDGEMGRRPDAGAHFNARYRVGNATAGNAGHDAIQYLVVRSGTLSAGNIQVRNPIAAGGGTAGESMAEAKLFAPGAVHLRRERAVAAEDYAEIAARNSRLQGAAAALGWTGSWYEARIGIDPGGTEDARPQLLNEIDADLYPYRRMGHDLAVAKARYVPLLLELVICVHPHHQRSKVFAELSKVFGTRGFGNGKTGFFHPDNLRFGGGIHLSKIIAAAVRADGVETAIVTHLHRLSQPDDAALLSGQLPMGAHEIAQLDNDPSFPENGQLILTMGGGR